VNDEDYIKTITMICNDYTIMMNMLKSINPRQGITAKTLPILEIVSRVFIGVIAKNIHAIFQSKAIQNAIKEEGTKDEVGDDSDEEIYEEDTDFQNFYI